MPKEKKGIIPPKFSGVACMSIAFYSLHNALALRKTGFEYAVIELLAITLWGSLDYLVLDMPPGIGDAALDVIRLMKKVEFCVVTTHSKVAVETVKKTLSMLKELGIPVVGVVQNMKRNDRSIKDWLADFNVPLLGELRFDVGLEDAIGNPHALLKTDFAKDLSQAIVKKWKNIHILKP